MPTNVDLTPPSITRSAATAQVFIRRLWSSDWTPIAYLYPDELVWAVAPGISQAKFSWRYGNILQADQQAAAEYSRLDVSQWYVKVVVSDPANAARKWYWYGVFEDPQDDVGGLRIENEGQPDEASRRSGRQQLVAFGMELLLDRHVIRQSIALDHEALEEVTIARGLTYNYRNRANKTNQKSGGIPRHRFTGGDDAEFWSTRDIAESLLVDQTPRNPAGLELLAWRMPAADRDLLPDWDQPVVTTHGRTTRDVLGELIDRRRLLSYYVEVVEDDPAAVDSDAEIHLRPFTFTDDIIPIDDEGAVLAANLNLRTVDLDETQSAAGTSHAPTTLHKADQVIVQGARRRNCFSVSYVDNTLAAAWPTALQTEYRTGASGAGDYPTSDIDRVRRNREARAADKFDPVYSRFQLPDDWDFQAGDGIGGAKLPVSPSDADLTVPNKLYRPELYLLPTIPLLEGHRYDGTRVIGDAVEIVAEGVEYREMPPLAVAELPEDPGRWVQLDRWGEVADLALDAADGGDRSWSADVEVHPESLVLSINVQGGPRHALGKNHFTAIDSSDSDEAAAAIVDWQYIIVTLAIHDDRFCEGIYPATSDLDPIIDSVRQLRIDVGDDFRLDYVASGTVVAVKPDNGSLQRTQGGGFINDDRPELERLARIAYEWYRRDRSVFSFGVSTPVDRDSLWIGDYIITAGADEIAVNSPVTEIRLQFGRSEGQGAPPAHREQFITGFGELDITRFV